jgi:hypothetical protein
LTVFLGIFFTFVPVVVFAIAARSITVCNGGDALGIGVGVGVEVVGGFCPICAKVTTGSDTSRHALKAIVVVLATFQPRKAGSAI